MSARVAALLVMIGLSGCGLPGRAPGVPLGPTSVRPDLALVRLGEPWSSQRLAVRRELVKNQMIERVVLSNDTALPFENRIEARTAWRGIQGSPLLRELPDGPFKATEVEAFATEQFPGAVVSAVTEASNRNGPYAYLSAAYPDGPSCVYAWQVVDAVAWSDGRLHDSAVDLRYCSARGTKEDALALFGAIDLKPQY